MNKIELYKKAFDKWGEFLQLLMVIEEMSELTKVISKRFRKDLFSLSDEIIEEIADVEIMLEQLIHMYDWRESVDKIKDIKLQRLERMINE